MNVTAGVDTGLGTLKLEVGSASETVEVSASTPLVETTQAQITTTFESTYLNNIPGVQENQGLDNLAVLLPGVSASRDANFSNTNGMGFTVDGLRGRSNDQQIDGQNNNDNSVAGPQIFVGDTEFVSQYQITTNNFGAEYGRNAGSVVNINTKSGTNTWHGSVYGTESNSVLTTLTNQQKNTVWGEGLTKPPRFNDEFTGATIGGAVGQEQGLLFRRLRRRNHLLQDGVWRWHSDAGRDWNRAVGRMLSRSASFGSIANLRSVRNRRRVIRHAGSTGNRRR